MKFANNKIVASLIIVVMAVFSVACGGGLTEAEPQVVVVTATPTATPKMVAATSTLEPTIVVEPTEEVRADVESSTVAYEAGTLLKGSGDGVFYLTEDGTRQHIYNWPTFLAFGFTQKDIVEIEDDLLEAMPMTGELTRLVRDAKDNLYWAAQGRLWTVNEWDEAVSDASYNGLLVTALDGSLLDSMQVSKYLKDGMLVRENDQVYYLDRSSALTSIIPVPAGSYDEAQVMDVPAGVLAVYNQEPQLYQVNIRLNSKTQAANVRQSANLEAEVIGVVQKIDRLVAQGRTDDGNWLLIFFEDQWGWIAADLVETKLAINLLPSDSEVLAKFADLPEAQPAAMTEESDELQPIYCNDTPIRGFGTVWGQHLDVQNTLGCPYGGEQGTEAAVQTFQNGLMLWLEADSRYSADPVYVFFNDGSYQRFGDLGAADPEKVGTTPAGYFAVGDKFSKVYWEGTGVQVKERLGHATSESTDSAGAFQSFWNGRMFWAEELDRIFVIYDYSYYDDNDEYIYVRTWESYEDTF